MRSFLAAVFVASLVAGGAVSSQAMPAASFGQGSDSPVTLVAGGCGQGWHRGPHGGCLRNYAYPRAHACPRGYHVGPYGHCRANW